MEGVFCEPDPSGSVRGQVGETSGKVDGGVCMSGPVAVYQLRVLVRPAASSAAKGFRVSIGFRAFGQRVPCQQPPERGMPRWCTIQ